MQFESNQQNYVSFQIACSYDPIQGEAYVKYIGLEIENIRTENAYWVYITQTEQCLLCDNIFDSQLRVCIYNFQTTLHK
jgi:hypothetical protein